MHQEIRHQNFQHEYEDRLQDKLISEDLLIPRIEASHDSRSLTINFNRDLFYEPQLNLDNFISSLTLMIESNLKNLSIRQLKKLPRDQRMRFCSIAEDFEKCTDIRTARHFNIHFEVFDRSSNQTLCSPDSECLIDDKLFQLKLQSKADKIARKLFKTKITNFHFKPSVPPTISYDNKNAYRPDSFSNTRTEQDFLQPR
jgi:hypothetical protein